MISFACYVFLVPQPIPYTLIFNPQVVFSLACGLALVNLGSAHDWFILQYNFNLDQE